MGKIIDRYRKMPSAIKAGLWFTICNLLQKGINFITTPFFTRLMTTEEYGLYSIYISWHSVITIFATLQLSYYVFNKGLVKYENDRDEFVVSLQSLSATLTCCFIIVYLVLQNHINRLVGLPSSMMICMLVQILFEPPLLYWTARKRFEYSYRDVIVITFISSLLNPITGVVLIKLSLFEDAAFARALSIVVITALLGIITGVVIITRAGKIFSTKYWKYSLKFNLPLIPQYLSSTILSSSDRIMIGDMCGKADAAIYSVAYSIGMACTLFSQAIHQAFLPWLYKRMKKEDYSSLPRISNAFTIGIMAILTVMMSFAPEIVLAVGTDKYADAIWAIPPICGSVFFIFLQNLFANIEYYFEKTKVIAVASVSVALLNVALNYIFIQRFGYIAAAYTTLVCYVSYAIVHYFVLDIICKKNYIRVEKLFNAKILLLLSIAMLAIIWLMLAVYHFSIIRYSINILILSVVIVKHKGLINLLKFVKDKGDH